MFFLATADDAGRPQCSYKGGDPGFVRVLDETTIAFPSYDGNGMYLSLGNLARNGLVGLLFIDFERPEAAAAERRRDDRRADPLLAEYPRAQSIVRVHATEVFPNCPRYIHRMQLVERSRFVPKADCEPPVPDWKRREWARDVLAKDDPANSGPPSRRSRPNGWVIGRPLRHTISNSDSEERGEECFCGDSPSLARHAPAHRYWQARRLLRRGRRSSSRRARWARHRLIWIDYSVTRRADAWLVGNATCLKLIDFDEVSGALAPEAATSLPAYLARREDVHVHDRGGASVRSAGRRKPSPLRASSAAIERATSPAMAATVPYALPAREFVGAHRGRSCVLRRVGRFDLRRPGEWQHADDRAPRCQSNLSLPAGDAVLLRDTERCARRILRRRARLGRPVLRVVGLHVQSSAQSSSTRSCSSGTRTTAARASGTSARSGGCSTARPSPRTTCLGPRPPTARRPA